MGGAWPEAGGSLLDELSASRDRFGLIVAPDGARADTLAERLASDLGMVAVRVGRALAEAAPPPTLALVWDACGDATILADLDLLLWPTIGMDILAFLAARARTRPTIAVWPGAVIAGRARYSQAGRPDFFDRRLRDCVVLTACPAPFPDDVPFVIERIAP